ncbi:MAG: sel1 repeat family protein [Bacteroidales bacterium]|nr:sel1 repeat family protein [Bacteroidales bacterium]
MKFNRCMFFSLLIFLAFPLMSNADQLEDAAAAIKNEDFQKAHELLNPLAEQNNAEAQNMLGALYVNGQGVEIDVTRGLKLIMKAAAQGHEAARINAFRACLDLANAGDTSAMYNVGYMCLKGWGGEYESDVCLKWLENAGQFGHENSIKILIRIYKEGMFGVTPDQDKATYWENLQAAFASGIDGKWEGSVTMGEGGTPMDLSYEFKTDGDKLTGTALGADGKKLQIKDGKIEGNDFSFSVDTNFGGMKTTINYSGTFYGDTLKLTFASQMGRGGPGGDAPSPITFIARRAE